LAGSTKEFPSTDDPGYDKKQADAFLEPAGIRLAAMESTDKPQGPLASDAILAAWAEWADSTRFSTRRLREGYDKREVDVFSSAVRDTFLGIRRPPLTWPGPPVSSSRPTGLATTSRRLTPSLIRPN
jgi:hypothetical protein